MIQVPEVLVLLSRIRAKAPLIGTNSIPLLVVLAGLEQKIIKQYWKLLIEYSSLINHFSICPCIENQFKSMNFAVEDLPKHNTKATNH
jgi:hypothetical protein